MLALEISVNGQRLVTAGTSGAANVCLTVDALGEVLRRAKPGHGPVIVRLGGMSDDGDEVRRKVLSWTEERGYGVGDEITIRVVDAGAADVDAPASTPLPAGIEKMLVPHSPFKRWLGNLFVEKERRDAN